MIRPLAVTLSLLTWLPSALGESIQFTKRASRVGDRMEQRVDASTLLQLRSRRGDEVLEERSNMTGRRQHRLIVATGLEDGRVTRADAHFFEASRSSDGRDVDEPVVGKTYHCTRDGDTLTVVMPDGATPPLAEFKIVSRAMQMLGRPNPLADYLAGRTVSVGERITLPAEVARRLMGLGDQVGEVERFALRLKSIEPRGVAVFDAEVEATGAGSSQMRMLLGGKMRIEANTCRVLATELDGPVGLLASRGGLGNAWNLEGTGRVRLAVQTAYANTATR